ncbi:MAG: protein phosphatase 2C domain-containing protein [Pseudomonadota bacterium]
MKAKFQLHYDAVVATAQGGRDRQEDAVVLNFPIGSHHGFAVLADGMGGHAAGNIASNIVVTEVFSELKMQSEDPKSLEQDINATLHAAIADANACIKYVSRCKPEQDVMGTTVLVPVLFEDRLYWISVGDSPLWLFRNGELRRLNANHSMAPEIDEMMRSGLIDLEAARMHPDRHCLTSVLMGEDIAKIDYSEAPTRLQPGDVVLAASDGLEFLEEEEIKSIIRAHRHQPSAALAQALMDAIHALDDPEQDNVAVCAIRVLISEKSDRPVPGAEEHCRADLVPEASEEHVADALTVMSQKNANGSRVICISKKVSI